MTALGTAGSSSNPPAMGKLCEPWLLGRRHVGTAQLAIPSSAPSLPLRGTWGLGKLSASRSYCNGNKLCALSLAIALSTVGASDKEQWAFRLNRSCSIGSWVILYTTKTLPGR